MVNSPVAPVLFLKHSLPEKPLLSVQYACARGLLEKLCISLSSFRISRIELPTLYLLLGIGSLPFPCSYSWMSNYTFLSWWICPYRLLDLVTVEWWTYSYSRGQGSENRFALLQKEKTGFGFCRHCIAKSKASKEDKQLKLNPTTGFKNLL